MLPDLVKNGIVRIGPFADFCENVKRLVPGGSQLVEPLLFAALRAPSGPAPLPSHWTAGKMPSQGWRAVQVKDPAILQTLQECLVTDGSQLGKGRDVVHHGHYSRLELALAWELENPNLWRRFDAECSQIQASLRERRVELPWQLSMTIRRELKDATMKLPGELRGGINEVRLLHGTKPETLLGILANGVNERFSSGLFGYGSYFAEDAGKCDQYTTVDQVFGQEKELHHRLFRDGLRHPNDGLHYIIVCRVVMGYYVRSNDGTIALDTVGTAALDTVHANPLDKRELNTIPGVTPPLHYHALLVELGERILRYREIVQFHASRIYPEYVIAYKRV